MGMRKGGSSLTQKALFCTEETSRKTKVPSYPYESFADREKEVISHTFLIALWFYPEQAGQGQGCALLMGFVPASCSS